MSNNPSQSAPWWQFGHVWLVVAGPLIVVMASLFTFYLAYAGMDALVTERGLQIKGHAGLETVDPAQFRQQLQMLKETRANTSGQGRVAGS